MRTTGLALATMTMTTVLDEAHRQEILGQRVAERQRGRSVLASEKMSPGGAQPKYPVISPSSNDARTRAAQKRARKNAKRLAQAETVNAYCERIGVEP